MVPGMVLSEIVSIEYGGTDVVVGKPKLPYKGSYQIGAGSFWCANSVRERNETAGGQITLARTIPNFAHSVTGRSRELFRFCLAGRAEFAGDSFAFFDGEDAVNGREFNFFCLAGRPVNFCCTCVRGVDQAEVDSQIA
jgi:hypothetical protein